jgi:hypothetical protein
LRIVAVATLVVLTPLSFIVVGPVIAGPSNHPSLAVYNVTFVKVNGTMPGNSGSASYSSTINEMIAVNGTNLTAVIFTISYVDQSRSPFTNPAVSATITAPNGTVVNGSGSSIPVSANGVTVVFVLPVMVPANATVEATSEEEAIAKAAGGSTNATAGTGDWIITLDIGSAAFGRFRPTGGITYTIAVAVTGFQGKATKI